MTVPSLPKLGTPPAPAPLRKIPLEEHFGHPIVFMRDSDGRFETRKEAAVGHLGPKYFEVVQRLLDFDTTRLQAMDEAGVDKVLLCFGAGFRTFGVPGILDRVEAQNAARIVNDFLAEQVSAHPSRYVGMATLALQDPDQAVRELERCITKLGLKGVMVNGYTQVDHHDNLIYLDDARLTPLWEALTALDVALYLHPRASHKAVTYDQHPELTGANWGFAPETATHALRIVYSGIFDRFPTAKLVLGHFGESLPFLAWRIQHGVNFSPSAALRRSAWWTISRRTSGSPRAATSTPRHFTARSLPWAPIASSSQMTTRTRITRTVENSSIRWRSARATVARSLMKTPRHSTSCRKARKHQDAFNKNQLKKKETYHMTGDNEAIVRNAYRTAEGNVQDIPGWISSFTEDGVFNNVTGEASYRGEHLKTPYSASQGCFPIFTASFTG